MWPFKPKQNLEKDYADAIENLKQICMKVALIYNPALKDIPITDTLEQHHLPIVNEELLYEKLSLTKNRN